MARAIAEAASPPFKQSLLAFLGLMVFYYRLLEQ